MKEIPGYLDITPGDFKEVYRHAYRRAVERLKRSVKAKDVMTRDVVFVDINTPMKGVAQTLGEHGISGLPVVDLEGKVVGVISEKDFLRHMGAQDKMTFMAFVAERLKEEGCVDVSIGGRTAGEIMTSPAVTVDENRPIIEIATLFKEKNINRVPVINRKGGLVGLVSRADIIESTIL
jgi:CBS-domain-containing membrane protein